MKAEVFIKVLKKVIREEVRQVVKEELKALKPLLNERHTIAPTKKVAKPNSIKQEPARRNYPLVTIDGALGEILKETADSMYNRPSQEYEDWPEMGSSPRTSSDIPGFAGMEGAVSFEDDMSTEGYYPTSGDPTAAFMKDYSSVLKSAEQKSQGYRG